MTVRIRSPVAGAISLARRLSFSKASRFICNFIWEYFLKTCAPKSLAPNRLERGLMHTPISIAGEQKQTVT